MVAPVYQTITAAANSAAERKFNMDDEDFMDDWQYEVANGDTKLGLKDWIENNRYRYEDQPEPAATTAAT